MEEAKDRIIRVLSEVLRVPMEKAAKIDEFSDLENWDSLFHLNVVLGIETEFGVHFDVQEVMQITSINTTINLLNKKTG